MTTISLPVYWFPAMSFAVVAFTVYLGYRAWRVISGVLGL